MDDQSVRKSGQNAVVPAPDPSRPPQRILVADDDSAIRQRNTIVLTHSGYAVDAAENGAVAWDTLQRQRYDLLITDNVMPKVSGVELLRKLREARMDLPVILATGSGPEAGLIGDPGLQPAALLLKPYSLKTLLATVRAALQTAAGNGGPAVASPQS